jgi:hypothetical protein
VSPLIGALRAAPASDALKYLGQGLAPLIEWQRKQAQAGRRRSRGLRGDFNTHLPDHGGEPRAGDQLGGDYVTEKIAFDIDKLLKNIDDVQGELPEILDEEIEAMLNEFDGILAEVKADMDPLSDSLVLLPDNSTGRVAQADTQISHNSPKGCL